MSVNEHHEAARTEILRISAAILDAICAHDDRALDAYLSPDFVMIGESSRTARDAFLAAVRDGGFAVRSSGFESIDVEVFEHAAVAAGVQRVEVDLPDGTRAVSRGVFTDVFVRDGARWLVRVAHSLDLA